MNATEQRQSARMFLDHASASMREAIAAISLMPDTAAFNRIYREAGEIEDRIRLLESKLMSTEIPK
jgi:hypothetical protein